MRIYGNGSEAIFLFGTIQTKYLNPTDTKGGRIKAWCSIHGETKPLTVTVGWDHALNNEGNHQAAAQALISKHNIKTEGAKWYCGRANSQRSGYLFTPDYCGYTVFKGN